MRCRFLLSLLALLPSAAAAELRYTVHSDVSAAVFEVRVCTDVARDRLALSAARGAAQYLRLEGPGAFARDGGDLLARDLAAGECRSYAVDAAAAARASVRRDGWLPTGVWLVAPKYWLWRSRQDDALLQFRPAAGEQVSTPWPRQAAGGVRVPAGSALSPALAAFGAVDERPLHHGGRVLRIAVAGAGSPQRSGLLHEWVAGVARSTLALHGALPLPDAQVLVVEVPSRRRGDAVPWGQSARGGGAAVHLYVRSAAGREALARDWVASHELAHLFHPYLGARGRWLSEGLASYYQNVLRARSGALTEAEAWRRLHAGFGRGRRDRHDAPLAQVSERRQGGTMRTYWSGAAFWLQADVALRQRGDSLDAVLERFGRCCLPARRRWTAERFVAELDRQAGGAPLFAALYRELAGSREFPSLQREYALLGLRDEGRGLGFVADGEAAALRHAIMQRP